MVVFQLSHLLYNVLSVLYRDTLVGVAFQHSPAHHVFADDALFRMANMNPKNELQEFLQKRQLPVPTYSSEPKGGHFCAKVKVRWKNGESLEDEGEGRKKKEAEMEAARSMLAKVRIREGLSPPTRSPPPSGLRGELLGLASPSSPSNSKGQLQEMLQKHGHPPPEYSVVRGSVNQMYTVKCVALTWGGQILAEGFGNARKKSDAEKNAAENVYPLVREVLNGGRPLSDVSGLLHLAART